MGVSGDPAIIIEAARPSSLRDSLAGSYPFPGTDVPGSRPTSLRNWMIASWNFAAERNRRHGMWSRNDVGAMACGGAERHWRYGSWSRSDVGAIVLGRGATLVDSLGRQARGGVHWGRESRSDDGCQRRPRDNYRGSTSIVAPRLADGMVPISWD